MQGSFLYGSSGWNRAIGLIREQGIPQNPLGQQGATSVEVHARYGSSTVLDQMVVVQH